MNIHEKFSPRHDIALNELYKTNTLRNRQVHARGHESQRRTLCGQDLEVIRRTSPQAIKLVAERRRSRREAEIKVYFQTGTAVLCGACSACWKMLHVERCSCSAWDGSYGSCWACDSARMVGRVVWWCSRIKVHFDPQDQVQYVLRAIGL